MNMYQRFYRQLSQAAIKNFPSLSQIPEVSWDHLVSPYTVELPKSVYTNASRTIEILFRLSRNEKYQGLVNFSERFPARAANESVLMAYDFHTSEGGDVRLVEINTNASGFLFSALMNTIADETDLFASDYIQKLKSSFITEAGATPANIAIVDDDLTHQKMFSEFLMYRDLFHKWGWNAEIFEASTLQFDRELKSHGRQIDFVYNRSTDFFLEEAAHAAMKSALEKQMARISPQPQEYYLLADKQRLIDFTESGWLQKAGASEPEIEALRLTLIPTFKIQDYATTEDIWSERRSLFFKPKQSYGGKSVYRGESVSRRVFERLMGEDIVIQKFTPAQRMPNAGENDPLSHWKFDLRFYVYRDQIQQVSARCYQGQVTNFSSPFGGFTRVKFV
jgi:hypothetical protein